MADLFAGGLTTGHMVNMERTNSRHLEGKLHPVDPSREGERNFSSILTGKLEEVNRISNESTQLAQQFITDPDSVDAHDVTIAMGKANLAVSLTKSVVDASLKAYREIVNLQ